MHGQNHIKIREIHPKDNHIRVDLSGTEGNANVSIYTDGSKTDNHVGARMVAVSDSTEIHVETKRLNVTCTVFHVPEPAKRLTREWLYRAVFLNLCEAAAR